MALTLTTFLIAISVYFIFVNLGHYLCNTYLKDKSYTAIIQTFSIVSAFMSFFWIFLAFIRATISDIKHLSSGLKRITNGELDLKISLSRKDELGNLARDISVMQHSLIERMEAERKAVQSNRELITSLSHDLRTPLTKQMCAIELALKNEINEYERNSLKQIYRQSEQIKKISDELFSYFLAEDMTGQHNIDLETFEAQTLFGQLLSEYADFLESSGFTVELSLTELGSILVSADISCLTRIMDNLASNIRKYADPLERVNISLDFDNEDIFVRFINKVRTDDEKLIDSNNIGIYSAQRMAKVIGGKLSVILDDKIYSAQLSLKIIR